VFDAVYNPAETLLLKQAKAAGCKTVSGFEMFVLQGAEQFRLWTGKEAPVRLMRKIVERALKALERARFNKYDTLTGLQNYEHVKDSYIAMLSRMRDDQIVIFGIIDVNDLKIINDHFGGGHDAGDQAIACVAEALKSAASSFENSFVARMSRGDEFGIFVVCDQPGMKDAKDDIVARLHEASFTARVPASDQVYEQDVSVSIGFAVADKEHAINFNLLKSEADAKMYEEKRKLKEGQDA